MPGIALRDDFDAGLVRQAARASSNATQARRLLAIAAVYDGLTRTRAAEIGGMDRQTLRDWVHRFNEAWPDGLVNRTAPGAEAKLTPVQLAALAEIVETGPDPATDRIVRWRRVDLKEVIEKRFGVTYHERSVSRLLNDLGFAHLSARPKHPEQDPAMLERIKKTSRARSRRR